MNEGHSRAGKSRTPGGGDGAPRFAAPQDAGLPPALTYDLDEVLREAVAGEGVPAAVAVVLKQGTIVYSGAFGERRSADVHHPVHSETIFDLASLTKMVATNTAIQILRDEGALALDDPVARFLPELRDTDKDRITVLHLLTHTSGLPRWGRWFRELTGKEAYLETIAALPLEAEIGARSEYSDLGFMLLGLLVGRVAGADLDEFARRRIFRPLGMKDTCFLPARQAWGRCAATEDCPWRQRIIQGEVHDENAFAMGGIAGHAGLFSTAPDLARFAQLLLDGGEYAGARILKPETVRELNVPPLPEAAPGSGLGWRLDMARNRWRWLASDGAFGHSGFTGTSLWIDPEQRVASILLTNAIHPRREGSGADALRRAFHTVLRDHLLGRRAAQRPAQVACGLDVELRDGCPRLRGKRVGLVCNQTAVAGNGRHAMDALRSSGARVVRLFAAEHGLRGDAPAGERVASAVEPRSGLPFVSLYGKKRRPSAADLADLDVLVYDMQQVGVRFYTHIWSLRECMQAAAECAVPFVVLDRPGVVGPLREGNILEEGFASFVGQKPIAWRHALTNGELARLYLARGWLGAGAALELTVVLAEGYRREMWGDETGMWWIPPSPNLPTLSAATHYPGTCLFEGIATVSEGRGTARPFEYVGAPFIDGEALAEGLRQHELAGVRFEPIRFVPESIAHRAAHPTCEGQLCGGVRLVCTDRGAYRPVRTAVAMIRALLDLYPNKVRFRKGHFDRLAGGDGLRKDLVARVPYPEIVRRLESNLAGFEGLCRDVLLYE
ncbi:MAG: DUF1343 domain-containing protein [Armatimonadota bacterium]|jgi:uncharacterized protein YbbC (DUF1343 family)/CubicO group peptidase (beta-lactamase class C family)